MARPNPPIIAARRTAGVRLLLAAVAIWVTVIGPGLCVGGFLQHLCLDCPPADACDHEDDCAADPCLEPLVQPVLSAANLHFVPSFVILPRLDVLAPGSHGSLLARVEAIPTLRKNLTRPESDLPLLI